MKKRIGALLLAAAMVLSLVPMTAVEVKAAAMQAEGAGFISRSDGVWLFPMDKEYYNYFSDWAGCSGRQVCPFHNSEECTDQWGDDPHNNSYNANGHNGFDLYKSDMRGKAVYAAADGTAYYIENGGSRGKYVIIEHPIGNGWSYFSYYQHLDSATISNGTKVKAGDQVGEVGSSGGGVLHLHFGIVLGHNKNYTQLDAMERGESGKGWVLTEGLQEGKVNVNPALNSPAGFPTGAPEVVPPLKAHAGSVMYTFDKSAVDIGASTGIEECEDIFPSWCEIEITSSGAYVKSMPCSKETNPDSADIEQPAVGTTYTTNGLCLNSAGNYWYRVTAKTGETGYVYSGDVSVKPLWPYVSGEILPETVSGAAYLGGTVINGGCELHSLTAYVFEGEQAAKDTLVLTSDTDVVNTTGNYALCQSVLDYSLPLQGLNAGWHAITVEACCYNYYCDEGNLTVQEKILVAGSDSFYYSLSSCSHSYSSVVTEPTCTEGGYTTYTCSDCGYSYTGDETAAKGHALINQELIKYPTCTEAGTWLVVCTRCDYTEEWEEPAYDHNYDSYTLYKTPTVDDYGVLLESCSQCSTLGATAAYLPALNTQDYDVIYTLEPTCTNGGMAKYTWKNTDYGVLSIDVDVPASGHNFVDFVVDITPTADRSGTIVGTCSECGETATGFVDPLNDEYYNYAVVQEPTCTQDGVARFTWKVTAFGNIYFDDSIPALGHRYGYTLDVVPTADQNGSVVGKCSGCGDSREVYLPILNTQDYDYTVVQEPTYAQEGMGRYTWKTTDYGTYSFDVTLDKLEEKVTGVSLWLMPSKLVYEIGEELDPTGLKLQVTYNSGRSATVNAGDEGLEISGFDSSSAGEKTVTVTYAGYSVSFEVTIEESEEPEPDPNAPQIVVSGARVRAGETFTVDIAVKNNPGIASMKLKVILGAGMFLTDITYNEEIGGQFTRPQTMDSPVVLNWVSAFEDAEGDWVFATLTFTMAESVSPGIWPINITYDPEDLYDMTETNIEFAVQTGIVEVVEYIPGDINGDGKVNNKDATRLLQYLSEWDVEVVEAALDVNGDGKVNNKDATRLLQYLSEWDVEIH